jgi:hypothetical protein
MVAVVGNYPPTPRVVMKNVFVEYPLRDSMKLVELGARSMNFVDLEFLELGCLAGKKWSGAVFLIWSYLELSQTPDVVPHVDSQVRTRFLRNS